MKYFLIIFIAFPTFTQKNTIQNNRKLESLPYEISVKISGSGYQRIISSDYFSEYPDIYLNDEILCESCGEVYDLIEEENILILKFPNDFIYLSQIFKDSQNLIEANFTNFYLLEEKSLFQMFFGCKKVKYINISKFNNNLIKVSDLTKIFKDCESLIYLDITSFDTSSIKDMSEMFSNCYNLISIDLSNFNIELVESMKNMFYSCKSLEFLNLSNFNTISVKTMDHMFCSCQSLTSIDISNFNTENVKTMISMFSFCYKIKVLDLSNFKTSSLTDFYYMFSNCQSLISLNISNFNTSNIKYMFNLFTNCYSLTSLDLSSFDTSYSTLMNQMFDGCKSLISLDLSNFNTVNIQNMKLMFNDCKSLISLNLSNFNMEKVTEIDKMFYNCEKLEYINFGNTKESDSISTSNAFYRTPKNIVYCINLANRIKSSLLAENGECAKFDCSDNWRENQLKIIEGTNTCIDNCQSNLDYRYQYENKCYSSCPNGTQPSKNNEYICKINLNDTDNSENNEINYDNICHSKDFFQKICKINSENIEERVKMINIINNEIMDGSLNELLLNAKENKSSLSIVEFNEIYEISFLSYRNENAKNNNISSLINFGQCQKRLKKQYHFNDNEELILFKMEYFIKGFNIPIIEYEIFSPNGTIKLNLEFCKDLSIQLYIPVNIDENNLYKYDPSNDFYNDRCYPYTTESGTDITLYDRKNEFNNQNMSL